MEVFRANTFVKKLNPDMILRKFTKEEKDFYAAPYPTAASQKPLLASWPHNVPFADDGKPTPATQIVGTLVGQQ